MVQRVENGPDDGLDAAEVDNPAGGGVHLAGDVDVDAIAVAVHPAALVAFGCVRQRVGGLESERLDHFRLHVRRLVVCPAK